MQQRTDPQDDLARDDETTAVQAKIRTTKQYVPSPHSNPQAMAADR